MLTLFVPKPYPGELIGSIVTRAAIINNLGGTRIIQLLRDGKQYRMSFFLPTNLVGIAEHMGMDAKKLLWKHTVFPYAIAFRPAEEVQRWETKVLTQDSNLSRLVEAGTDGLETLQYCLKCTEENRRKFGESYWHLLHNLPAVHVCHKHGDALLRSKIPTKGCVNPFNKGLPHHQDGEPWITGLPTDVEKALAEAAKRQVTRKQSERETWDQFLKRTNALACEKGYLVRTRLASSQISLDLARFYGEPYLTKVRSTVGGCKSGWPSHLVRLATPSTFAPVRIVLLSTFLQLCPPGPKEISYQIHRERKPAVTTDEELAERVRKAGEEANKKGIKTNAIQLIKDLGHWHLYRHGRHRFPLTAAALQEFRFTPASQRLPDGFGPEQHLNAQCRARRYAKKAIARASASAAAEIRQRLAK